jgi:hypothetical protein
MSGSVSWTAEPEVNTKGRTQNVFNAIVPGQYLHTDLFHEVDLRCGFIRAGITHIEFLVGCLGVCSLASG